MLLEDLFTPLSKDIKKKSPFTSQAHVADGEKLGKGTASTVKQDNSDPHMVQKRTHTLSRTDGFSVYAKFIIDNNLAQQNPYFPRIYVMKNYKDNNGTAVQKYQMEKLLSSESLERDNDELLHLYAKMFGETGTLQTIFTKFKSDPNTIDSYIRAGIQNALEGAIEVVDPILKDAIKWLKKFENETHKSLNDFEGDNILYRRTQHGLQVVISDPVY